MSEISKLAKELPLLIYELTIAREEYDRTSSQDRTKKLVNKLLENVQRIVAKIDDNLKPRLTAVVSKLDQIDPVTGTARFGDATKAKVHGLGDSMKSLDTNSRALLETLLRDVESYASAAVDDGDNGAAVKVEVDEALLKLQHMIPAKPPTLVEVRAATTKEEVAAQAALARIGNDEESHRLHQKAEAIRLKNMTEAQRMVEMYESNRKTVNDMLSKLSGQFKPTCVEGLKKVVSYIDQQATDDDILLASQRKVALKMVLEIIQRIIARPDDNNCRKIRLTHPVIKERVGDLLGGIELLLSIGFHLKLVDGGSDKNNSETVLTLTEKNMDVYRRVIDIDMSFPSTANKIPDVDNLASSSTCGTSGSSVQSDFYPLGAARKLYSILTPPVSMWDIILEMHEPATSVTLSGIAGKDTWLEWFDMLGLCREYLQSIVK